MIHRSTPRWAQAARVLMVVAVAVIGSGLYLGLQWSETEAGSTVLASQTLRVDYEATTTQNKGPWPEGTVFDRGSIGVPIGLAPRWNITATYDGTGTLEEGSWSSSVTTRETGPGGRDWWVREQPLEPTVMGDQAWLLVNMTDLVQEARRLEEQAEVPGELRIEIRIQHRSTVPTGDGEAVTLRVARLRVQPEGGFLNVGAHDDGALHEAPLPKPPPVTAAVLASSGSLLAGAALFARKKVTGSPMDHAVPVRDLQVPPNAIETDEKGIAAAVRETQVSILHDREKKILFLMSDPPLVAYRCGADAFKREGEP